MMWNLCELAFAMLAMFNLLMLAMFNLLAGRPVSPAPVG